jgi:hypothetical protein
MSAPANPYAAPAARVDDAPAANAEAEAIRKAHLNHEASIKAVGALYYLGGGIAVIAGVMSLVTARADALLMGFFLVFGVGGLFVAWGLRRLRPWARIVGCVFAGFGLLGFPVGTLINAYILYLFLSKKGGTVFSADYQAVIAATPHVKYRTSLIVWIFLAVLLGLLAFGLLAPMLAGR